MRLATFCLLLTFPLFAQQRPPITGLAHVGFFVSDLGKADSFYGGQLGFAHFSLDKPSGGLMLNYYKVNQSQYIEIYPGLQGDEQDRLSHVAFATPNANAMRDYLVSKGVKAPNHRILPGIDGNLSFMVDDPEGRHIEFVQYLPTGLHARKTGLLPDTRISQRMIHAGFIVHDRAAEDSFYRSILGFELMWYGGKTDDRVDWVDMRVPDGADWLEYMLNVTNPSPKSRGVQNHFALGVANIHQIKGREGWEQPKIGRDGKWQLNLYDPDLTRVELMEFKPSEKPCCSEMHTK